MTRAAKLYSHANNHVRPELVKTEDNSTPPQRVRHRHKARNITLALVAILLVALIAGRIYLPVYVTNYVNRTLDNIPGYTGSISDVDIALFRGAYVIHDLKLLRKVKDIPVPFIDIKKSDLSIQWGALFKGSVVGDVTLYQPTLNFAVGKSGQTAQTGEDTDWTKPIKELMPLDINFGEIRDGTITYKKFGSSPNIDLFIKNLNARATNIRNADDRNEALPSDLTVRGESIGGGSLSVDGKLNIIKEIPDMDVTGKLERVSLPALNTYSKAFAGIDFTDGNFDVYTDLNVKDGQVSGFVKPLVRNMEMIDENDDFFDTVWESAVSVVAEIFSNQKKDQIATQIALEGNLNSPETDFWSTINGILRNAFVKAYTNTTKPE
jgi:hypothetical protein